MPKVTVIIPSYNHEHYVADSINSVLKQSYKDIELIVIDDGSKDNSPEIIRNMQTLHSFTFKTQTNQGLVKTLNRGLELSTGDYIVFFASDDIMMLDRIEKQVCYMEQHPEVALCGGNMLSIDDKGVLLREQRMLPERILAFDDIYLKKQKGIPAPTMFFRKSVLGDVGGFDADVRLDDLYIAFKIASKGYKIVVLNDVLAYYRYHSENSMKNLEPILESILQVYGLYLDHPAYESMRIKILQSYLIMAAKNKDRQLMRKILKRIPLKYYNLKTLRGIIKLVF